MDADGEQLEICFFLLGMEKILMRVVLGIQA